MHKINKHLKYTQNYLTYYTPLSNLIWLRRKFPTSWEYSSVPAWYPEAARVTTTGRKCSMRAWAFLKEGSSFSAPRIRAFLSAGEWAGLVITSWNQSRNRRHESCERAELCVASARCPRSWRLHWTGAGGPRPIAGDRWCWGCSWETAGGLCDRRNTAGLMYKF